VFGVFVEYKGRVEVQCSESCSIVYHTSCWRKFKGYQIIGGDKELLNTQCPTPDCCGLVRVVVVFDAKNKVKIKVSEIVCVCVCVCVRKGWGGGGGGGGGGRGLKIKICFRHESSFESCLSSYA